MQKRLIEDWLPVAALGEESVRERRSMTSLPPTYYLHVWWARRPLVASRAAILASLLPADADKNKFLHVLGIHGDPVEAKKRIAKATEENIRLGAAAYGYPRAFSYSPSDSDKKWLATQIKAAGIDIAASVLDPTAGGGSIPFEALRLGLNAYANDLNPVASLIEKLTFEAPLKHGPQVLDYFRKLGAGFIKRMRERLSDLFPEEPENIKPDGYLFARTIRCPHCNGLIPLSPNWRLAPDGTGVKIIPNPAKDAKDRICSFEIVQSAKDQSLGTVAGGQASCPYPDCGRTVTGDDIKKIAQAGNMGEQLYAIVFKEKHDTILKSGKKGKPKWIRAYRAPKASDDVFESVKAKLNSKLEQWLANDIVPDEAFPPDSNDDRPIQYGMPNWREMFSPRQLYCHATGVEVYRELLSEAQKKGDLGEAEKAAFGYLAIALDKAVAYDNRGSRWIVQRELIAQRFERHDYSQKWSFCEMALLITGAGYDWAIEQTAKSLSELIDLLHGEKDQKTSNLLAISDNSETKNLPTITITNSSATDLSAIPDHSIDAIVMDPPYYDNVMYAELSDFFYVWLKRTAGYVYPELFRRHLTDKDNEAVANPALFRGQAKPKELAYSSYRDAMAGIFAEAKRVLKSDGIMTVMFTHKATDAWDALASGLMEAGFMISASWPVSTEAEGSLHIREKAAASSTIFLVCRPRPENAGRRYWDELEPKVRKRVLERIGEFQKQGLTGIDLYLACFGPALEIFSAAWPVTRQTANKNAKGDPYIASPEDALQTARSAVKDWQLSQLLDSGRNPELDPLLEWYCLAWLAFGAASFPYNEAMNLARVVGLDLERDIIGRIAAKKQSDLILWDAQVRANKTRLDPMGQTSMLDAIQYAIAQAHTNDSGIAAKGIAGRNLAGNSRFIDSMAAMLQALPKSAPDAAKLRELQVLLKEIPQPLGQDSLL